MSVRKKRNIIISILACVLVLMAVGYALLRQNLNISSTGTLTGVWKIYISDMSLKSTNGKATEVTHSYDATIANFEVDLYMPGDYVEYYITVTNAGNIDATLNQIIVNATNSHEDIKLSHTLEEGEVLDGGESKTYTIKIEFDKNATKIPDIEEPVKYEIKLIYQKPLENGSGGSSGDSIGTLSDKILADNIAQSDSSIDFSQPSSDTNGKGLYYTSTNTEGNATTYYFRGDVDNNYVKFGSETKNKCTYNGKDVMYLYAGSESSVFEYNPTEEQCLSTNVCANSYYGTFVGFDESVCTEVGGTATGENATYTSNVTEDILWRVVRINEDGSTRLITESPVGSSVFNSNIGDNAYVGYMYGTAGSTTYEATHTNTNNSTIKTYLDNWYQENLLSYSSYMSLDAGFCNDRSIATAANTWTSDDTALGYGTNTTYYGAYNRLENTKQPQFACSQTNDLFTTTTSSKGNKALTYPIGLITADETIYAGGISTDSDTTYYLNNNTAYWTMSPWWGDSFGALAYYLISYGVIGVRPAINLASNVEITGGDGTLTNPYVVK